MAKEKEKNKNNPPSHNVIEDDKVQTITSFSGVG